MTNASGDPVSLTTLPFKKGFGDNTLVWEPKDIKRTVATDTKYTVTLENVSINNEVRIFSYDIIFFAID